MRLLPPSTGALLMRRVRPEGPLDDPQAAGWVGGVSRAGPCDGIWWSRDRIPVALPF